MGKLHMYLRGQDFSEKSFILLIIICLKHFSGHNKIWESIIPKCIPIAKHSSSLLKAQLGKIKWCQNSGITCVIGKISHGNTV